MIEWSLTLANAWAPILETEFRKPYFTGLLDFLQEEYAGGTVYPKQDDIFRALRLTDYGQAKVVILGQDPYHGAGQAHGLSFSVQSGVALPPSLRNIFKELNEDLGCPVPTRGDLTEWAKQGVLLLNTVLTVRENAPNSHKGKGWERFTDRVIEALSEADRPIVFILWGRHAQEKQAMLTNPRHLVIASPHPSPLAARTGFFGSKPFSRANQFLREEGVEGIDWSLEQG